MQALPREASDHGPAAYAAGFLYISKKIRLSEKLG